MRRTRSVARSTYEVPGQRIWLEFLAGPSRFLATAVAAGYLMTCLGSQMWAGGDSIRIDIARNGIGVAPAEFDFWISGEGAPGQWAVIRERNAPSSEPVIEQFSHDKTKGRFPLAIYRPLLLQNLDLKIRVKAIAGDDRMAGVAVRLISPDDYYAVGLDTVVGEVGFFRMLRGRVQQLESAQMDIFSSDWRALRVLVDRNQFAVSLDGRLLFTAFDDSLGASGRIALLTRADTVAQFKHIEIIPLPWQEP